MIDFELRKDDTKTDRLQVFSDQFVSKAFSIDQEDVPRIIQFLRSKIYSDKLLAVAREYAINAVDAHIEAGIKRPVEVILPTDFEPRFHVRDFAYGLSEDEMWNVYIKFGKSRKRQNLEVTGAYGIGCKAGFAYRDMFSIISYYHGIQTTYIAKLDEQNDAILLKLSEQECGNATGIEIIVEILPDDVNKFRKTALELFEIFSQYPDIKNLTTIEQQSRVYHTYFSYDLTIPDSTIHFQYELRKYRQSTSYNSALVVTGNIGYTMDYALLVDSSWKETVKIRAILQCVGLRIYCQNGLLDIDLSREALEYTQRTCQTLKHVLMCIIDHMIATLPAWIEQLSDYRTALIFGQYVSRTIGQLSEKVLTYRGYNCDMSMNGTCRYKNEYVTFDVREYTRNVTAGRKTYTMLCTDDVKILYIRQCSRYSIAAKVKTIFNQYPLIEKVYVICFDSYDDATIQAYITLKGFHLFAENHFQCIDDVERYVEVKEVSKPITVKTPILMFQLQLNDVSRITSCLKACTLSEISSDHTIFLKLSGYNVVCSNTISKAYTLVDVLAVYKLLLVIDSALKIYALRTAAYAELSEEQQSYTLERYMCKCVHMIETTDIYRRGISLLYDYHEDRKRGYCSFIFETSSVMAKVILRLPAHHMLSQFLHRVYNVHQYIRIIDVMPKRCVYDDNVRNATVYKIVSWYRTYIASEYCIEDHFELWHLADMRAKIIERYPMLAMIESYHIYMNTEEEVAMRILAYIADCDREINAMPIE